MASNISPMYEKLTPNQIKIYEDVKKIIYKRAEEVNESISEEMLMPYRMYHLTPAMLEEARVNLNETEETKPKALQELRELVENEANLISPTDDDFLLMFLRARKFDAKNAFKLLQNFWRFRKDHPEIYENINEEVIADGEKMFWKNFFTILPYRDRNGCIVAVIKLGEWNPEDDPVIRCWRIATVILLHSIRFPATQIMGYRLIFDIRELSWTQFKMATLTNILMIKLGLQECFPARYRGVNILCENRLFQLGFTLVYPFVPEKYKKRLVFHGKDLSGIREYIHPLVIPEEFGGYAPSFGISKFWNTLEEDRHFFMEYLNYGYKD